ncbi:MAG: fused MFS/spermidine synthase [Acidobacteriota bacterium]|nr:fused MFS/spermidine synthase [Acidobacteriota bacterium]
MNLLSFLFFASGCAALIYETVWFHLVQLVVGASSISVAVLLCSFMGGMALGSALLPRLVPASIHPLRVVAALEAGIAALGIIVPLALPYVQQAYVAMVGYGYAGVLLRATACAVVLTPPTMLMGATLPAIARWFDRRNEAASSVGFLYTANIAGGAVGTVLAGFYLLRVYDTVVAGAVAVAINIAVAIAAWWLAVNRDEADKPSTFALGASVDKKGLSPQVVDSPSLDTPRLAPIYVVAAMSGFTALGAEVVWTRQLSLLFGASVYTFSLILAVFLAGLGAGSLAGSSLARRSKNPAATLGRAQLLLAFAIAFGAWMIVYGLPLWQPTKSFLPWVRSSPPLTFAFDAVRCAIALMPATLLWGASFPLMLAAARGADFRRQVSRITAINTAGALIGTLALTLIGIPMLGSQRSQQALVLLAALAGLAILSRAPRPRPAANVAVFAAAVAIAILAVPPVPGRMIAYGRSVDSWSSIKRFLYLAEGATASVAVTEGIGGMRQFHIAGKVEASDMDVDMRLERMLGHIPALVHPHPRSVLIVGVGAGVTAGALAIHPEVERIVICEIEPVVPTSARQFFGVENHHVFDDPRVQLVFDDARHFLQTTDERFDIITSDPIHPWVRGAATLYSLEYLQLARAHLNPGGVVTQWIPLYETDVPSAKSEIATFAQVFPDTTLWNPDLLEEGYDLVALGRVEAAPISEAAIALRINASAAVRESLSEVTLKTAAAVLSTYAGRGRDLAPWLADAQINRERHLRLQYLAGLAANTDQRFEIFQQILQYRRYPADLFEASAELESQIRLWSAP